MTALVTPATDTVTYAARREDLRLVMIARYRSRDPVSGQPTGQSQGAFIGFKNGIKTIPKTGRVTLVDTIDGGEVEMDAEEVNAWLRRHRLFGDLFEGFFEVAPAVPAVSTQEMNALMEAATSWDVEKLEQIIAEEEAGWGRPEIIEQARAAAARIRDAEAKVAAAQKGK